MCVNKKWMLNKKYTATKKNGGNVPVLRDERQKYIQIPCQQCYICRRKKAREWRMRISEDIKVNPRCKVVTMTFDTPSLKHIVNKINEEGGGISGYELDNQICKWAVKHFRERWRKKYKRSPRYWLITELGHGKWEHVHMHGIIWEDERYMLEADLLEEVQRIWGYGNVDKGKWDYKTETYINYVNAQTANYFTKYVQKRDDLHKEYKQIILTSKGIGKAYLESDKITDNTYRGSETNQLYNNDNGGVLPMAEYYRRKLYTDEQREQMTSDYLDKNITYIEGREVSLNIDERKLKKIYDELKEKNARLGYEEGGKNYDRIMHENAKRRKLQNRRLKE